jgi:hypothetical protein
MSKAIRTVLSLAVGLLLFSAMTTAQDGGKNTEKDKNKPQHSRLGKVAFWRHHQDADKNAKPPKATQAGPSKQAQAKTTQVKPASAQQIAGKKDQKQEQRASKVSKPSTKKAPPANKTKPPQAQDDPKAALLKQ